MNNSAVPQVEPYRDGWIIIYVNENGEQHHIKFHSSFHYTFKQEELLTTLTDDFQATMIVNIDKMNIVSTVTPFFPTRELAQAAMEYIEAFILAWQLEVNVR